MSLDILKSTEKVSEFDMHTNRFIWRDLDAEKIPDHYMLKTVTLRDKPGRATRAPPTGARGAGYSPSENIVH